MSAFAIAPSRCHREDRLLFMTGRRHRRQHHRGFGPGYAFGRRAGRGDIRAAILVLLAEEPMHGYQVIQELAERTGGVWRPSPGSVYPTLQQLEDEELVRETASDSGKRVYELTDAGREQAASTEAPWNAVAGEGEDALVGLRDLGFTFGDPQGAFFIYTDASSSGIQAFELSYLLLREGHVLIFPGTAFGDKWVDWLRISLLQPQDQLALALERMAGVLKRHR